ncbi:MAG: prokaryotic E2 ligase family D protein [Sphingobacterium sp.]|jgi:PRTRC genetic system protein B|nr:prokaryotic E2 ligase family D protein [Sphingobacterium sp.]
MKDVTNNFELYYQPSSALVFYWCDKGLNDTYVEYYDIDNNTGAPINAHPLTVREAKKLAKSLNVDSEAGNQLKSDGLLPSNLLYFDAGSDKIAWYSKAQFRDIYFTESLGIPSGRCHTPALLWVADRESLNVHALTADRKPTLNTPLFYAPFFNVRKNGNVCLGSVSVKTDEIGSVRELMKLWETYFFNSYFSHLMENHNPIDGNCVLLWESLMGTEKKFPTEVLFKSKQKLKDILK